MFDKISKALMALFESNVGIETRYPYEATEIKGFPALTLTPSANENEYSTTTENRRVYAFVLRLYVERSSSEPEVAEQTMRQLVDSVLDTIDRNYTLSGLQTQTGYTFLLMNAAPSVWGYAGRENDMRVAEIKIQLHFDIDTTQIT